MPNNSTTRMPQLVVFDLDYTLWDLWIDAHATGPLKRDKNTHNEVLDKNGETISFYKHVPGILHRLNENGVKIAIASRTSAPALARQALDLLLIPPPPKSDERAKKAVSFFDQMEIYPGSKLTHMRKIHEGTGIPYTEMLFFDDEHRNKETERLGVTFYLVRDGMDNQSLEKGLVDWRRRNPVPDVADDE